MSETSSSSAVTCIAPSPLASLDNASSHKTPKVRRWLAAHPRFHLHFTPTSSSWINLVERWFGELTTKLLRRGAHRSVRALNAYGDTRGSRPEQ